MDFPAWFKQSESVILDHHHRWRLQDEAGNMPALRPLSSGSVIPERYHRWRLQDEAGNMPALQL
jgi:hypothetical protein